MTVEQASLVLREDPCEHVALLRLNRPDKRNALNNRMIAELAQSVREAEAQKGCRCIVLCGQPGFFSAGADVKEMATDGIRAIQNRERAQDWAALETTRVPMVAAVSGLCLGGGHELAMLCDIVIADETAQFSQPEIKLGHIPGDGATQRLIRAVGKYAAMRMILTGEPVGATEALSIGLAAEIVPEGRCEERAIDIARLIARNSSCALGLAVDAVRAAQELALSAGLERERRNIALAFTTRDQKEGLAAFLEKRAAKFTDE